jgi:hypothetical protein
MAVAKNMQLISWGETNVRASAAAFRFCSIGAALSVVSRAKLLREQPIGQLMLLLEDALVHDQLSLVFSSEGRLVGFAAWAWLSDDVQKRLSANFTQMPVLHRSEWKEGNRAQVILAGSLSGSMWPIFRGLWTDSRLRGRALWWISMRTGSLRFTCSRSRARQE